jgi:tRNA nucleotidyltransferase (CCA-adding enzyme)
MSTGREKPTSILPDTHLFRDDIPQGVLGVLTRLDEAGHAAYLVGGCVRDRLRECEVEDFDVTTAARPAEILALFPRAIPIGLRHGTVMQPTPDGPVDITSFRSGSDLESDLAHRDFTINAIAWDPLRETLIDPFDGRSDLAGRRLRSVGRAEDRFREDPVRALRAARLVAALDLEPDRELPVAMAGARSGLQRAARERVRSEIERLLSAPRAERGLALLRESGIEADLAPGTADDAVAVVAALAPELLLRLAGWLRGTNATRILAKLRFPKRTTAKVAHLLRNHPIDAGVNPKRDAVVRKLIRRAHVEHLPWLCALRRAELTIRGEGAAREIATLAQVELAIERVQRAGELALHRFDLAVDGADVMEAIGTGPGRHVGQALRYLTERVIEDPSANTTETLRRLLADWQANNLDH